MKEIISLNDHQAALDKTGKFTFCYEKRGLN
jgi:hypothetical protein